MQIMSEVDGVNFPQLQRYLEVGDGNPFLHDSIFTGPVVPSHNPHNSTIHMPFKRESVAKNKFRIS